MKTSKEIWDSYPDKTTYKWLSSGIHTYNVLLRRENGFKTSKTDIERPPKLEVKKGTDKTRLRGSDESNDCDFGLFGKGIN